jgi:hypothetical protein
MASAARMVESRWAMTMAVRPVSAAAKRLLHRDLRLRVEVGGRLVEQHHLRSREQEAGDREPLALAARQPVAALADHGVEPSGSDRTSSVEAGALERLPAAPPRRRRGSA